jgi:hypothetical protein
MQMSKSNDEDLFEDIEPEALRAAEFMQAQTALDRMVGRKVTAARIEETRIVVETDDGSKYFFYGFMGEDTPEDANA